MESVVLVDPSKKCPRVFCEYHEGGAAGLTGRAGSQDPHFKVQNHRRRIISVQLLAEYAFLLAPGGRLYTATDVPEARHPGSSSL